MRYFNPLLIPIFFTLIVLTHCKEKSESKPADVINPVEVGLDLSFLPEIEDAGFTFKDENGSPIDMIPYLKSKGVDYVRLRLWHTPDNNRSSLDEVLAFAADIKQADMEILLDFHYSDWWADPGNQTIPEAWSDMNLDQMKNAVYTYTLEVLSALDDQNTLPTMVQIGNETNSGFLWDIGRVGGGFDSNWPNYIDLVEEGIRAVRETDPTMEIMLHFAGTQGASWYFGNLAEVDYDIIGLSYYSIWHGKSLSSLEFDLRNLVTSYDKDLIIVETAYPFTLQWNDWTNNIWGQEDQLISGYPATPAGQAAFLEKLMEIVGGLPDNRGRGICYWAPDWVAYNGNEATDGSTWENAALFDFNGRAMPALDVFENEE